MNRTCFPDPELGTFEVTKNSTFGDVDSGFNSRNDSDLRQNDTRLSNLSTIGDGACSRMGECSKL